MTIVKQKRNSTIECLRIISMFLIVMFHFCGRGLGLFDLETFAKISSGGGKSCRSAAADDALVRTIGSADIPLHYGLLRHPFPC